MRRKGWRMELWLGAVSEHARRRRLTTSKTKAAATAVAVWRGRFSEKLSPVRVCPSIGEREKPLEKDKRERERVSE